MDTSNNKLVPDAKVQSEQHAQSSQNKLKKSSRINDASIYGAWPRGLKIALIASSSTILTVVGLFSLLMYVSTDVQNTQKTKAIAASFMKISEPLPEGFQYVSGIDFLGTKMVMIGQCGSGAVWTLVHVDAVEGALPPDMVIKQIENAAKSSRHLTRTTGEFVVREKGMQTVGGRELTYEAGEFTAGDVVTGSLIGAFMPTKDGTTCIFVSTPLGRFDSVANRALLQSINTI